MVSLKSSMTGAELLCQFHPSVYHYFPGYIHVPREQKSDACCTLVPPPVFEPSSHCQKGLTPGFLR